VSFVAVAIGGSALIGAGASIIGGNKAANAQNNAAAQSTAIEQAQLDEAKREYEQNRTDLAPYRAAGTVALGQIGAGTAAGGEFNSPFNGQNLTNDPGYQFRLDQGNRGIEASAAARGGVLGGGTLKALSAYNSGEASQEYNNAFNRYQTDTTSRYNRLASIAGIGQTATNSTIAASEANTATQQAGANQIAGNIQAAGNANASSYVNTANAIGGAANTLGSYFALNKLGAIGGGSSGAYGIAGSNGIY
jgi:hypothetical protein